MADTEHNTKIKITGDAQGAEDAIGKLRKELDGGLIGALSKVRLALASVSRALGLFWLAWNGVQLVISGWQKLTDLMTATQRRLASIEFSRIFDTAAISADRLIGKQKEINALLDAQARKQALLREVGDIQNDARREAENSRREVERAGLLAGVTDPRQRQALQDRFAAEDEARRAAEAKRGRDERVAQLRQEVELERQRAARQGEHYQSVMKELLAQREQLDILERWKNPDKERIEATKRRIAALEAEGEAARKAADAAREAADAAGLKATTYETAASYSGRSAADIEREASWRNRDEADRRSYEEFTQQLAENEMRGAQARHFATLDDAEKVQELNRRETDARERMTDAQSELADEMAKDVSQRSEERIARSRATIEEAQREALGAAADREALERSMEERRQAELEGRADQFAASFADGGNRLTALGLGSGADNARTVDEINGKMTTVLEVLRQELDALRGIDKGGAAATFGA